MKQFVIENSFWEIFPEAKIGVLIAEGLNNRVEEPEKYVDLLRAAETNAKQYVTDPVLSQNPAVAVWREAFLKFKTKKGARASIEALLKRVQKNDHLPTINPLVDLYNTISLNYGLPCGGEDIDTFVGDLRLKVAEGGESFVTLGSEEDAPALAGEVIYADDAGAVCRCWNWRESVRTMLREDTTRAFLCIELVDRSREDEFLQALDELRSLVEEHLGAQVKVNVLDRENPKTDLTLT